ncbi:hypothetical protein VNI00_017421 [Paramarasmius palmivorus]|uniref:SHSP domain-containing protein n=1 Tax=Paramarasmius palmivorus TaxID=297713 RepID=A0AAW0B5I6_9AGAR
MASPTQISFNGDQLNWLAHKIAWLIRPQVNPVAANSTVTNQRTTNHGPWEPRSDVFFDPQSKVYIALFEVPGVRAENINVIVSADAVIVEGSRYPSFKIYNASTREWVDTGDDFAHQTALPGVPASQVTTSRPCVRSEMRYGRFKRSFSTPPHITTNDVRVYLYNGILHVQWPLYPTQPNPSSAEQLKRKAADDISPSPQKLKTEPKPFDMPDSK